MKIEESVRRKINEELETANRGAWVQLVSEIQYFGDELCIFVRISDGKNLARAYELIRSVLTRYMDAYTDTKFSVGFSEKRGEMEVRWDALDDDELRTGKLYQPLGSDPDLVPLADQDVFGDNRK